MNNRIELINPTEEIQAKALLPIQTAQALQVTSEVELEAAGEIVRILKDLMDEVNRVFEPIVKTAYEAHKAAKTAQNEHLKPLLEAEGSIQLKMNLFLSVQKAEREKAKAERRKAEEHLKQQPALQDVEKLFAVGAIHAPRLPEVPAPPKAAGIGETLDWKWKIVDIAEIPSIYWMLDEKLIDDHVRRHKDKTSIPGIEVFGKSRAVVKR